MSGEAGRLRTECLYKKSTTEKMETQKQQPIEAKTTMLNNKYPHWLFFEVRHFNAFYVNRNQREN